MDEKKKPTDNNPQFEFYDETRTESKKFRHNGVEFKLVTAKDFSPRESPSDIKEIDPIQKPRKDAKWDVPHEAYQLIYDFLPEFDRIWNAIKALPGTLNDPTDKQWAALECFDTHSDWKYLTRELLNKPYIWDWRPGNEKSDLRGKLIEKLFKQYLPNFQKGYVTLGEIAKGFETCKT